jgi:hypothetical protein
MTSKAATGSNRRSYFRIDDLLQVSYRIIPQAEVAARIHDFFQGEAGHHSVASEILAMRHEANGLMREISRGYPEVAQYLVSIDQRLEVLARALTAKDEMLHGQSVKTCNISASGVAIPVDEPLEKGTRLEMLLLLLPSYVGLQVLGEVVGCPPVEKGGEGAEEGAYQLRVNFTHIHEHERDLLIKHVIHRQGEMLRQQRGTRQR